MNSIKIGIKNRTNLTAQLEKKYDITYYEKASFLSKILLKENKYPDIYFHKGPLTADTVNQIENSKLVIVNAQSVKNEISKKISNIDIDKITVLYPYYYSTIDFDKKIKKAFKEKHQIESKSKIIFFRGNDLAKSGLATVMDILSRMYKENYTLIIESTSKQIVPLRLQLERSNVKFKYVLFEDCDDVEELFIASDIFILPTSQKYFSTDILKAMYYRNAVFLMEANYASEIIDTFSLIQSAEDRSVSFKVDSLLINKDELKNIQKENQKIVKKLSLENSLLKISNLIDKSFDF